MSEFCEIFYWDLLGNNVHDETEGAKAPTRSNLLNIKGCSSKYRTSQFGITGHEHQVLQTHFKDKDYPEVFVVEQCFEYVYLIYFDNSAVYLVEQGHEDERVEHDGVKGEPISWFSFLVATLISQRS